jgi:hypothetical protein
MKPKPVDEILNEVETWNDEAKDSFDEILHSFAGMTIDYQTAVRRAYRQTVQERDKAA